MWTWALRSIIAERGTMAASLSGIAMAFVVALSLDAIFAGETLGIIAYPTHAEADVWVMQEGVANMHMASSLIHADRAEDVQDVAGVSSVTPILYLNTFVRAGGEDWFSYVVGLPPQAERGGPWEVTAGSGAPEPGGVILSEVVAHKAGVELGDRVSIGELDLAVTGLSGGTFSMANTITWVALQDLREHMSAPRSTSYLLVEVDGDADPAEVTGAIMASRSDLHAMTAAAFVASDRRMAMHMGADVVQLMTVIGTALAAMVLAFTIYAATLRRGRELAVAKALGAPDSRLVLAVLFQSVILGAGGWLVALAMFAVGAPLLDQLVPDVSLVLQLSAVTRLAAASAVVIVLATLAPALRVLRTDPALAFS